MHDSHVNRKERCAFEARVHSEDRERQGGVRVVVGEEGLKDRDVHAGQARRGS